MTRNSGGQLSIDKAAKHSANMFKVYISVLLGTGLLLGLLTWALRDADFRFQDAVQNDADERIKLADDKATAAEQKVQDIEVSQKWRVITPEQTMRFVSLSEHFKKGPLTIAPTMADPEAVAYADQLKSMLEHAGWSLKYDPFGANGLAYSGLVLVVHSREAVGVSSPGFSALALSRALHQAGIVHIANAETGIPDGSAVLVVGHKPVMISAGRLPKDTRP